MKLFVGLGNPGDEYAKTRHNVGFMFADALADYVAAEPWREKFNAFVCGGLMGGEKILIVKPLTYMNESGLAVRQVMDWYKIDPVDTVIVHDDMDLPAGKIRIRAKGGSGGHNGIKSVIAHTGSEDFARFRVGIGRPKFDGGAVNHVLHGFDAEDAQKVQGAITELIKAAECFVASDINMTMNRHNPRKAKKTREEKENVEETA